MKAAGAGRRAARVGGRALAIVLRLAVSTALVLWLLRRIGVRPLVDTILAAELGGWIGAVALMLASNLIGAYQWSRLLGLAGVELPGRQVVGFYLVGIYFNNFFPTTIGGDVSRILDAGKASGRRAAVVGATLVDRLLAMTMIALLAAAAALALRSTLAASPGGRLVLAGAGALLLAACGTLGALMSERLSRLGGRWLGRLPAVLARPGTRVLEALAPVRAARSVALRLLLVSALVQVMRVGTHVLVAGALDIRLEVGYFFLFVPLLAALVMVPISINGIGVRESMGAVLFGLVGVGAAHASTMQFLAYLAAVAASLVGGVIFLVRRPVRAPADIQSRP